MKRHRKIPLVGETPDEKGWDKIERMCSEVEDAGFEILKILNYKEGTTKLIGKLKSGINMSSARTALEPDGWQVVAPHYSQGKIEGFKLTKTGMMIPGRAWS